MNLECEESLCVRLSEKGRKKISEVLARVQEVRWNEDIIETAGIYTFFCGKENGNYHLGNGFLLH